MTESSCERWEWEEEFSTLVQWPGWYSEQQIYTTLSLGAKLVVCQEAEWAGLLLWFISAQIGFTQSSRCPGSHCPAMHYGGLHFRRGYLKGNLSMAGAKQIFRDMRVNMSRCAHFCALTGFPLHYKAWAEKMRRSTHMAHIWVGQSQNSF